MIGEEKSPSGLKFKGTERKQTHMMGGKRVKSAFKAGDVHSGTNV